MNNLKPVRNNLKTVRIIDEVHVDLFSLKRIFGYDNISLVIRRALCASGYNREFIDNKLKLLEEEREKVEQE